MTPQQKATELMSKFIGISLSQVNELVDGIRFRLAKESALIAVEEIIKANPIIPLTCMLESEAIDAAIEYWNEVKAEIEKL